MTADRYKKAYVEVLEIIRHFSKEEYSKIPTEKIKFYEQNKDMEYAYKINPKKHLSEQNISREANAILITLFRDYFATKSQKEELEKILIENQQNIDTNLETYGIDGVFAGFNKKQNVNDDENAVAEPVEYNDTIFTKLKNFISKWLSNLNKK